MKLLCSPSGREELPPWLHMATVDLRELSRWGAMWNAVVEQVNKANAMSSASGTKVSSNQSRGRNEHIYLR